jgi:Na+/proline symporter
MNHMPWLSLLLLASFVGYAIFASRRKAVNETQLVPRAASWWGVSSGLFTLVGGGEIITLSSLGFAFGWSAISLFIGYAAAFAFLGFSVKRDEILAEGAVSLPDRLQAMYGRFVGRSAFVISFAAFLALLVLQFTVGGSLLADLLSVPYWLTLVLLSGAVALYLVIGRYFAVLETDKLQGYVMGLLGVLMLCVLGLGLRSSNQASFAQASGTDSMPVGMIISLTVTGFFVAAASSDVWQRMIAAKSPRDRKIGGIVGGIGLLWQGVVFTALGVVARNVLGSTADPNTLVGQMISQQLGAGGAVLAISLVTCAVLSTADTEVYLLASMIEKMRSKSGLIRSGFSYLIVAVSAAACLLAVFLRDAVTTYTWILMLVMTIAPLAIITLFVKVHRIAAVTSVLVSISAVLVLRAIEWLTLENMYVIPAAVSLLLVLSTLFSATVSRHSPEHTRTAP